MKSLLLVTSPPACGKTFVSKELAKALNPIVYLDKDTLMKSLNITPTILAKLNPELTIKLINKDYLASLLTHNFSRNLNNTIKELNMLSNNNTKYLTRDYLEKC